MELVRDISIVLNHGSLQETIARNRQASKAPNYIYPFTPVFKNILWKFIVPGKIQNGNFLKN